MNSYHNAPSTSLTLPISNIKAVFGIGLLVIAAVSLPSIAHLSGMPVRQILPMHWPVILAGLVFGWRGGALVGILSPTVSYFISGMPYPPMLPPMTIELGIYGFVTGFLREQKKWNAFISVLAALIIGRIVFMLTVLILRSVNGDLFEYMQRALLPGVWAALGQILLLPFASKGIIKLVKSE